MPRLEGSSPNSERSNKKTSRQLANAPRWSTPSLASLHQSESPAEHLQQARQAALLHFNGLHELCTATGSTAKQSRRLQRYRCGRLQRHWRGVPHDAFQSRPTRNDRKNNTSTHDARRPYTADGAAAPCAIAQQSPRREHGVSCEWTCPCAGPRHHGCKVCQTSITSRQHKTRVSAQLAIDSPD